jgi:hypothetical protein
MALHEEERRQLDSMFFWIFLRLLSHSFANHVLIDPQRYEPDEPQYLGVVVFVPFLFLTLLSARELEIMSDDCSDTLTSSLKFLERLRSIMSKYTSNIQEYLHGKGKPQWNKLGFRDLRIKESSRDIIHCRTGIQSKRCSIVEV